MLFTLAAVFVLFYLGARWVLKHQAETDQRQYLASFALATREAVLQREDVAVLNFMRLASQNPDIVYTAFYNPVTGSRIIQPPSITLPARLNESLQVERRINGLPVASFFQKVQAGAGPEGWVEIGYSNQTLEKEIQTQLRRWMGLGAFTAGVTLILGSAKAA